MDTTLVHTVNQFKPISLDEMNSVALMKRTDTKYVIHVSNLPTVLKELLASHKVLEIKGRRIMNYASLYLDTNSFKFYLDHHNGRVNRTKIRQRKYVDSDLTFLEIKKKNGKGETNKFRIQIDDFETELSDSSKEFITEITEENYNLTTSLWNSFNRITLVNLKDNERVTIDLNLTYTVNDKEKKYNNIVVVELKQSRFDRKSAVVKALKNIGHNPYSISKYCIGVANLYQHLKQNTFKSKLLKINNISA
ncbi:polyphosphate polymerase domain-containing protein [Polaribacter sp.]|uniref:polyphosphate polymerase domain-containing protein n=1 Tax=Polaribacter sp. TaxID=1920175 RepID=UPI003F6C6C92